jgi:hypothetical protein
LEHPVLVCLLGLTGVVGCAAGLPRIRTETFERRLPATPADAAPVFAWKGARADLKTYWGDQEAYVLARAYFPPASEQQGEGIWRVEGRNHEGKPLPFLGVIHKYVNESGTELAEILPRLDLSAVPDGLYLAVLPGVEVTDGKIAAIRPTVYLYEIRGHAWKPFRVRIPLVPEKESPLTPAPPPSDMPAPLKGTPIPVD